MSTPSNARYDVIATMQSPLNEPVDMRWTTNSTAIGAANAIVQLLDQNSTIDTDVPASVRPALLSIRIEVVA